MIRMGGPAELAEPMIHSRLEEAEASRAAACAALERERKAIGEIQQWLLPAALPEIPGFEMSPYYRASEQAGGDYYDVVPLVDGKWGFVMADVSGHGTPAAVIMAVLRTLIHTNLPHTRDKPARVFLDAVNQIMSSTYLRDGRFVTVWCAMLDPVSRRLTYASAGHNPPRLLRNGSVVELDAAGGFPLGIDPAMTYEEVTITLEPDDLLVVYTDGITEAMRQGLDGRSMFGTERLDQILIEGGLVRAHECTNRVIRALEEFTEGEAPTDDQTMLIMRVC